MKKITLLLVLLFSVSFSAQNLTDNLLLYYPFDNNTDDQSGNGYNAIPFGVIFGNDRFGNPDSACYFDGIDDYINLPNLQALKANLPVSFSFWIKYDSTSYQNQVVFNTSFEENRSCSVVFNAQNGTNKYIINCADGNYFYAPETRRSYISNTAIDTNSWHQIAIVVNSEADMKIYVDCVESGGANSGTGGNLQYSVNPGCIGRHDRNLELPPDYFKGYIDDFRYWDRALSQTDVDALCSTTILEIADMQQDANIIVFPNPADVSLSINAKGHDFTAIAIYNTLGKKVYSGNFSPFVDVSSLVPGVYFVKLTEKEKTITQKIIIK